jgi:hypothetical protein
MRDELGRGWRIENRRLRMPPLRGRRCEGQSSLLTVKESMPRLATRSDTCRWRLPIAITNRTVRIGRSFTECGTACLYLDRSRASRRKAEDADDELRVVGILNEAGLPRCLQSSSQLEHSADARSTQIDHLSFGDGACPPSRGCRRLWHIAAEFHQSLHNLCLLRAPRAALPQLQRSPSCIWQPTLAVYFQHLFWHQPLRPPPLRAGRFPNLAPTPGRRLPSVMELSCQTWPSLP